VHNIAARNCNIFQGRAKIKAEDFKDLDRFLFKDLSEEVAQLLS
jgi:hypothetical protein